MYNVQLTTQATHKRITRKHYVGGVVGSDTVFDNLDKLDDFIGEMVSSMVMDEALQVSCLGLLVTLAQARMQLVSPINGVAKITSHL